MVDHFQVGKYQLQGASRHQTKGLLPKSETVPLYH